MAFDRVKKFICAVMAAAMLLSLAGCALEEDGGSPGTEDDAADIAPPVQDGAVQEVISYADPDGRFSLDYDPSRILNPLSTDSSENYMLCALMYEGLFSVAADFTFEKLLCADYSTENGVTWSFDIIPGVTFHDGTPLTAQDAVYSVYRARASERYGQRLKDVDTVTAAGDLRFTVKLKRANYDLPVLLDVPMIKYNTSSDDCPPGTGPYQPVAIGGGTYLVRFDGYREPMDNLPEVIPLKDVSDRDLAETFSRGGIDMLLLNPTGTTRMALHVDCDTTLFDTTRLQYIGFNTDNIVLYDDNVRRAVSYLIDREMLCAGVLEGMCRPAPLVLSSALEYYDEQWESAAPEYSLEQFSAIFSALGFDDYNGDGFLDYPWNDSYRVFSLKFIVNADNPYDLEIARDAVFWLKHVGLNIELEEMTRKAYEKALKAGNFDLYLATVQLPADFDLTQLLCRGGSLNYGDIRDNEYSSLIADFLGSTGERKTAAAKALCLHAAQMAHIIPIDYKFHTAVTHRGAVKGLTPSQSTVFHNLKDLTFDLE